VHDNISTGVHGQDCNGTTGTITCGKMGFGKIWYLIESTLYFQGYQYQPSGAPRLRTTFGASLIAEQPNRQFAAKRRNHAQM
jgi:hypothetical protein